LIGAFDAPPPETDPVLQLRVRNDLCYIFQSLPGMTRDDPAAFAPPPAFGPFRVLHQIGIGALGPVFRTYEPTRDRLVAVKVFRLDVTPEQAQALADELGRAADAGLFHPSIVEPVAAGVEGTTAYRAEEYVAAESLDVAMRHYAPATLDRALPFLTQLAGAIDFARTAGVGHGALHLRDVFVTPDEARASGFGIVEALERVGVRAPVRRPYTAPERIAGGEWSTPADVFSLAAIAYELLTGRRPSGTGDQIGDLAGENLGTNAPAIRSVLARAMNDDPARRYATALAFASALESAAHTGTADAGAVAVPQVAAESPRLSPPLVVADAPGSSPPPAQPAAPRAPAKPAAPVVAVAPVTPVKEAKKEEEEVEEPEIVEDDDVAAERDGDAAHHLLMKEMKDTDAEAAPTLFDEAEEESVADLALENETVPSDHSARWKDNHSAYAPTFGGARHFEDVPPAIVERPRRAILPMTLMLILGLLLGFAIDRFMVGGFENTPPPAQTVAEEQKPTVPPPAAATAGTNQPGRAYSEQSVAPSQAAATAPRSGEAPPVPGDVPGSEAPATRKPAAPAPVTETARLTVISTPTHAGVTVSGVTVKGRWRGRTPLTLDTLRFGSYTVRVVQPGYSAPPEEVVLSARQPMRTLSVRLQPASARGPSTTTPPTTTARSSSAPVPREGSSGYAGTIYVDSRPRGAKVLIDGKVMGTTPASIPDIPIGSHVIRLELADHHAWTTSTRVAAGEQARVTGSLEPIR
jgi:Protein kinase domain/PEGA domain